MPIAFDTETCLFRAGVMAPELVCVTFAHGGGPGILRHTEARYQVEEWLSSSEVLVGHNVAYDTCVIAAQWPDLLPHIFFKYENDQITDTMIRQKLLDIAAGCYRGRFGSDDVWIKYDYSLLAMTKRLTGVLLEKDEWRLRYGELRNLPLDQWPTGALKYATDDARATLACWEKQEAHAVPYLEDQYRQARISFWSQLMSVWGLRTNAQAVERLRVSAEQMRDQLQATLVQAGLVRKDGSRDTKAAAKRMVDHCTANGIRIRRTPPSVKFPDGQPQLDEDACEASGDDLLEKYAQFTKCNTLLSKDVTALLGGTKYPIHTHFGMAETGRRTSSHPNVQNWGKKSGARECFEPRPGHVYATCDVDQLELRTLAQVCLVKLGESTLAKALNAGQDPHTLFAAGILGLSYDVALALKESGDQEFDDVRQGCKFTNFALPGGVGPAKMVVIARSAGIDLGHGQGEEAELERAKELKAAWLEQWPEMKGYLRFINSLRNPETGLYDLIQWKSNRYRGGAKYTAACNSWFQGLGADATGRGVWYVSRACYIEVGSPLYGCRPVNYSHDDLLTEVPEARASPAANEMALLFIKGINEWLPDVPATAKPLLTRVWSKKAKRVLDTSTGDLLPWMLEGW
jgi:hypothetical protein